jgi:hypothetical protein
MRQGNPVNSVLRSKAFFFEKKKQKTSDRFGFFLSGKARPRIQKFFGSFFKKELLPFFSRLPWLMRLRRSLLWRRRLLLRGGGLRVFLVLLGGFVMADGTAGGSAKDGMMARHVAGNAAHRGTLEAAGV